MRVRSMAFDSLAARPGSAAEEERRTQVGPEETALPYTPGELADGCRLSEPENDFEGFELVCRYCRLPMH
jgi:hypothetical protein